MDEPFKLEIPPKGFDVVFGFHQAPAADGSNVSVIVS
jgi:hypothetical protein